MNVEWAKVSAAGATVREPGGVVPPGCYAIRVLKEKEVKQFGDALRRTRCLMLEVSDWLSQG
jgi:hypothetical protein